jgi:hypothetical protein
MFIPRGKTLHDNLATSYVMVDALVEDLCEGGFSGVVEIVLRNTDAYILIDHGSVVAVIERNEITGDRKAFTATTIGKLVARSRVERGRVAVHSFPPGATTSLASLVDAEPLYTALSTDFADLEKMIAKLRREGDRQWFVEVCTHSGSLALVHIADERCRVMRSDEGALQNDGPNAEGEELKLLLEECARVGGTFDVYFKRPGSAIPSPPATDERLSEEVRANPVAGTGETDEMAAGSANQAPMKEDLRAVDSPQARIADSALESSGLNLAAADPHETPFIIERNHEEELEADDDIGQDKDRYWSGGSDTPMLSAAVSASSSGAESIFQQLNADKEEATLEEAPLVDPETLVAGDPVEVEEAETMAEVKRLMSEIARTIDDAARAVEQRDAFSMYLRAGQLRIADRYPFLDPFGAEFEYLSGEIAFIGKASPAQFKEGLTESLRLAVVGLAQSSAQPARLRAHVTEDLDKLLERLRPDLERFGLDETIEQIVSF